MRILLYPHDLELGGSPINAIDLAGAVQRLGHEVVVIGRPGPLAERITTRGLRLIPSIAQTGSPPTLGSIRELRHVIRTEDIDLIHTYEYWPCVEGFYASRLARKVPMVATVLSMSVPRYLPRTVPLIVGTREIQRNARSFRSGMVALIEPPVDIDEDHPSLDASTFLRDHGLDDGHLNVVIVSRITPRLKLEGLQRCVAAMTSLAAERPIRLIVVGWGRSSGHLGRQIQDVNDRLGRRAIALIGPMVDPRPAYAAADIVVGMGSSALRGMAFGKPTVVVGEGGFSEVVSPETVDRFLMEGFYGRGDGDTQAEALSQQLRSLIDDRPRRLELGRYSRELVCQRFSLDAAGTVLAGIYDEVVNNHVPRGSSAGDGLATAGRVVGHKLRGRVKRIAPLLRDTA